MSIIKYSVNIYTNSYPRWHSKNSDGKALRRLVNDEVEGALTISTGRAFQKRITLAGNENLAKSVRKGKGCNLRLWPRVDKKCLGVMKFAREISKSHEQSYSRLIDHIQFVENAVDGALGSVVVVGKISSKVQGNS